MPAAPRTAVAPAVASPTPPAPERKRATAGSAGAAAKKKEAVVPKAAAAVQPAKPVAARPAAARPEKSDKADKPKKPKLVRDSFTIPKPEYAAIDDLKKRSATLGHPVKKSELLRAGLKALSAMGDDALRAALAAVPAIKTGRPAKT